jgi:hypothetical protein
MIIAEDLEICTAIKETAFLVIHSGSFLKRGVHLLLPPLFFFYSTTNPSLVTQEVYLSVMRHVTRPQAFCLTCILSGQLRSFFSSYTVLSNLNFASLLECRIFFFNFVASFEQILNGQVHGRGAKLTSYVRAVQRIRMREAIPPLTHTLS